MASLGQFRGASTALADPDARGLGAIAGTLIGGPLGGAAGCAAGSAIGAPIDQTVSNNLRCQACSHVFDGDRTGQALT